MGLYLAGAEHAAITEEVPSGFGPLVWVAELRTRTGLPLMAWIGEGCEVYERPVRHAHRCWPLSVGATEAEALAGVRARAARREAVS